MADRTTGIIGVLTLIAFILNAVATFTKDWIRVSTRLDNNNRVSGYCQYSLGIVPYDSDEGACFTAASWLMFISLGLFFLLILINLHVLYKVHRHGSFHNLRHSFFGISLLCLIIGSIGFAAFTLNCVSAANIDGTPCTGDLYLRDANIGISPFLALFASFALIFAMPVAVRVFLNPLLP